MLSTAPSKLSNRQVLITLLSLLASPVVLIFLSTNFVNVGNLLFNVVFSHWMGPELFGDLAVVLTLKLSILGVLGAIQMAISKHVAIKGNKIDQSLARLNKASFLILWFALPILLIATYMGSFSEGLGLSHSLLIYILILSLPFAAPLSILRGIIQGKMDVTAIILSANVEMFVRLLGAIMFWLLGFGAEGVVAAISLSIMAGWFVLKNKLPLALGKKFKMPKTITKAIAVTAFPFAILQLSQVLLLEGDILLSKIIFDDLSAGFIAALGLFQRIEFYACFGLISVLLPDVAKAVSDGETGLKQCLPIFILFMCVTACFLGAITYLPKQLILIMVGEQYLPTQAYLLQAHLAASAFTISYLMTVFLTAIGEFIGVWMMSLWVPLHMGGIYFFNQQQEASIENLVLIKCVSLSILMGILMSITLWRMLVGKNILEKNKLK